MTRSATCRLACVLTLACSLILAYSLTGVAAEQDNWPQFRGPAMNPAVADNPNLPERWSLTDNVESATEIPGATSTSAPPTPSPMTAPPPARSSA